MKRISHHALAALAALLIGASNTNLCAATFSDDNWISMNPGFPGADDPVSATVVDGSGNLYISGWFTVAGDVIADRVAKWNGSSWSALGSGMNGLVYALAVSGSNLYAGGQFSVAGGSAANFIAKWDGANWSALGSGINGTVFALAVSGSDLYVGGGFTTADGSAANSIAKWNGSSWSPLGSGMNNNVRALAVLGSDLYAGGWFGKAGGKISPYLARARIGSRARALTASNGTATLRFSGVTGDAYDVQRTTSFTPPITWTAVTTTPLYPAADGSFTFTDTNALPGSAFYRAQLTDSDP